MTARKPTAARSLPSDSDLLTWLLLALVLHEVTDGWEAGLWLVAAAWVAATLFVVERRRKRAQRRTEARQ